MRRASAFMRSIRFGRAGRDPIGTDVFWGGLSDEIRRRIRRHAGYFKTDLSEGKELAAMYPRADVDHPLRNWTD